jgi:hypothetical protein
LSDALTALNGAGVTPILLKGCAMWALRPAADSDRMISDLDLMINEDTLEAGLRALRAAGFAELEDELDDEHHPVMGLGRPQDAGMIDLHLRAPGPRGIAMLEALPEHCRPLDIVGGAALLPSPAAQLLINALHDQLLDGDFWRGGFSLRHLLDAQLLAAAPEGVNGDAITNASPKAHVRAAIAAHLHAARALIGADIPSACTRNQWGAFHFARQRQQYEWPAINAIFRGLGLDHRAWRALAQRS